MFHGGFISDKTIRNFILFLDCKLVKRFQKSPYKETGN